MCTGGYEEQKQENNTRLTFLQCPHIPKNTTMRRQELRPLVQSPYFCSRYGK
jgi:hypothetical protein